MLRTVNMESINYYKMGHLLNTEVVMELAENKAQNINTIPKWQKLKKVLLDQVGYLPNFSSRFDFALSARS